MKFTAQLHARFGFACCLLTPLVLPPPIAGQTATKITTTPRPQVAFTLEQRMAIGALDGADAFGRIMDAKMSRGLIYVADDLNHHIAVYDTSGSRFYTVGRDGDGPGEFSSPWRLALEPMDSLFVWDTEQARISVFSPAPELEYVRSFRVPPHWLITSMAFDSEGHLWVAAFGPGEDHFLHRISRQGRLLDEFGKDARDTRDLAGFDASLLGGTFAFLPSADGIVYSRKSPYELLWFGVDGRLLRKCTGDAEWTTDPLDVVRQDAEGAGLEWNRYVHSARILKMGPDMLMNQILDPVTNTRTIDLIDDRCRIVRRTKFDMPLLFVDVDSDADVLLAVRSIVFPEIVLYDVTGGGL